MNPVALRGPGVLGHQGLFILPSVLYIGQHIMIIFLQYPITDIRLFQTTQTGALPRPLWPVPTAFKEFIHSVGQIQPRKRGGVSGWVGEHCIATANRAICSFSLRPYIYDSFKAEVFCAKRFFFFDGVVSGKFEAVFVSQPRRLVGHPQCQDLLQSFLKAEILVRETGRSIKSTCIANAGPTLSKLYLRATTARSFSGPVNENWILAGMPCVIIYHDINEKFRLPRQAQSFRPTKGRNTIVHHWWETHGNSGARVWAMQGDSSTAARGEERALRIALARLHTEYESLRAVLLAVARGEIEKRENEDTDFLQQYINEATRRLFRAENRYAEHIESSDKQPMSLARLAFEKTNPGIREGIILKLRAMGLRPSVLRKAERVVNNYFSREVIMGDKYTSHGQTGAMGPHSTGTVNIYEQQWQQVAKHIDLASAATELAELRAELRKRAKSPEEDNVVALIGTAEVEAKHGNGASMLEKLAGAGKWALDVAKEVGGKLVLELLKRATGLS